MHYLIDGHNLIGKMPDISLDDPDDEVKLILQLRSWAARGRKRRVTVIFDQGLPGGLDKGLSSGQVKVLFASAGRTADSLLTNRIRKSRSPKEFTLVSSDLHVIKAAEKKRMPVLRSEEFVERLHGEKAASETAERNGKKEDQQVSAEDLDMWLEIFGGESAD